MLGFGNAQNGVLKMLLDYGAIGFVLFVYVCIDALRSKDKKIFPVNAFLIGMAICSTVEINISEIFFLGLAIINAYQYNVCDKKEEKSNKLKFNFIKKNRKD